jgi:outer membrane protein assembly factor BamB
MRMRVWVAVALGLMLVGVAGCSGAQPPAPAAPSERSISAPPATAPAPLEPTDWPTYHHDNSRTGYAPGAYGTGKLTVEWTSPMDGAVYGQPLIIGDRVYAATEHDTVYALDVATGRVKWHTTLGDPMRRQDLPCGNIDPLGITGTMAYDQPTGLLFAVAETAGAHHTLYGLDARTGTVKLTRSAEPPKGEPVAHQQRAALTVLDGRVYIAYGGLAGDCGPYIGSVVSLPIIGPGPAVSYAIPTTREGGIWSPGGGIVDNGQLLYAVGNGEQVNGAYDGSDSVIRLGKDLTRVDWFAPDSWADDNVKDLDLGSMTPVTVNNYVFIAGKRGVGYTLHRQNLGGVAGEVAQQQVCRPFGGAAIEGDTVYLPCKDGARAVQIDANGAIHERWHTGVDCPGSPVVTADAVWTTDYDGGIVYELDKATGAVRQQIQVGQMPHFASPSLSRGFVYVGTLNGVVQIKAN